MHDGHSEIICSNGYSIATTHFIFIHLLNVFTVSAESIHKTSPRKAQVEVNRYGTSKVAPSTFSSHGPSRTHQDPSTLGVSRRLTSSTSSLDSECSQRGSSSRTHYTALADIPRAKRLRPDLATLKVKGRKCSPGKAEVERMFGQERRWV